MNGITRKDLVNEVKDERSKPIAQQNSRRLDFLEDALIRIGANTEGDVLTRACEQFEGGLFGYAWLPPLDRDTPFEDDFYWIPMYQNPDDPNMIYFVPADEEIKFLGPTDMLADIGLPVPVVLRFGLGGCVSRTFFDKLLVKDSDCRIGLLSSNDYTLLRLILSNLLSGAPIPESAYQRSMADSEEYKEHIELVRETCSKLCAININTI